MSLLFCENPKTTSRWKGCGETEKRSFSPTLRSPEYSFFFCHRNGIIKLSIYFQEYNYRTISESAATTVSGTLEMARGLSPAPSFPRGLVKASPPQRRLSSLISRDGQRNGRCLLRCGRSRGRRVCSLLMLTGSPALHVAGTMSASGKTRRG